MSIDVIARGLALLPPTKYPSGAYCMPDFAAPMAGGAAAAAGTIRLSPGYIHAPVTTASLVERIQTGVASGNCQIAIYAADPTTNNPTGAPLFSSSSQSTTNAVIVEVAASLTLPKGLYWGAVQVDTTGAATVFYSFNGASAPFFGLVGSSVNTNFLNATNPLGYTKTGTFGTWPTLTGNATTDSLTLSTNGATPAWGFKVA